MTTSGARGTLLHMPPATESSPSPVAPRATAATMAPNPAPPGLTSQGAPAGNGGASAPTPQEGPPRPRQRRGPRAVAPVVEAPPSSVLGPAPGAAQPLTDEELQDLGAIQVLAARAGVSVDEYVDDARRLCRSYARFQAYVAARKAAA